MKSLFFSDSGRNSSAVGFSVRTDHTNLQPHGANNTVPPSPAKPALPTFNPGPGGVRQTPHGGNASVTWSAEDAYLRPHKQERREQLEMALPATEVQRYRGDGNSSDHDTGSERWSGKRCDDLRQQPQTTFYH